MQTKVMNLLRRLIATFSLTCTVSIMFWQAIHANEMLSHRELLALEAFRNGTATQKQAALLFSRNDAINRAALRGYIDDSLYQTVQSAYAKKNAELAELAAREANAEFRVQDTTSATYSPGTDSDYITKVESPDQVRQMQESYNRRINQYLNDSGVDVTRSDWHVQLDTDFMADPSRVSKEQFLEIARLNNDAYKSRAAAVYEAVSRAGDGTLVTPEQFTAYANEMKEFTAKKQKLLAQMRADPRRMTSEHFRAEFQKIMAQEQKYISRIESSNELLRNQRGLAPVQTLDNSALWSIQKADDGTWRMVRDPSIAKLGSKRTASAFRTTAAANAVAQNSLENALERLAQSSAEAALKDPDFSRRAASDIAQLLSDFPASRKGQFLDTIARQQGSRFAGEVAGAMRVQHRAVMQAGAAGARAWATRILSVLEGAGVAYDLYEAGTALQEYARAVYAALDPDITDEEAEVLFAQAQAAGLKMGAAGGIGAAMEAYPPLAAAMGTFVVSYYGSRWVLENTATNTRYDFAIDYLDRHMQAAEKFSCAAREFFGYESACQRLREVDQKVLAHVLRGIKDGRWTLADGRTMLDVIEAIRRGNYNDIRGLLVHSPAWVDATETVSNLQIALNDLRSRCELTDNAPASFKGNSPGRADTASVKLQCNSALDTAKQIAVKKSAVETLARLTLSNFNSGSEAIGQCSSARQLSRGFEDAQSASSYAADAARAFAELVTLTESSDAIAQKARSLAKQAVKSVDENKATCTSDTNLLIDAVSAARQKIKWKSLVSQLERIDDSAVGVAESRSPGALAKHRDFLESCGNLADPYIAQLNAMESILTLQGVPELRQSIEESSQLCQDKLDGLPTASGSSSAVSTTSTTSGDSEAMLNCMCACNQKQTNFSCSYNTEDTGWSPSCRTLSNGPCICKAMGCFRAMPIRNGECYNACAVKHGG